MTNLDKMKAEIQQMSADEFIDNVVIICDRIDADIQAKYCKQKGDCQPCCREWLNREVKE